MVKSLAICIPESIQCIREKPRLGWVEPSHLQTELTTHRTMLMFMLVDGFFLIKHIMVLQFGGKFGNLGSHLQEIIATGQQLGENL